MGEKRNIDEIMNLKVGETDSTGFTRVGEISENGITVQLSHSQLALLNDVQKHIDLFQHVCKYREDLVFYHTYESLQLEVSLRPL